MTSILIVLALSASFHESRTLVPVLPKPAGVSLRVVERVAMGRTFALISHSVGPDGSVNYSKATYRMDGTPVRMEQEGDWGGRMNRFVTDFSPKGETQRINEAVNRSELPDRTFRDPTTLWFWRVHPKVGESVDVTILFQNTIATGKIRFTYEGDETMTLAGRTVRLHRVREFPLDNPTPGVFTLMWYDDAGMNVKRYHEVGGKKIQDELAYWY